MIGMRNKIAHDYSDIDIPEIWKTAKNDIPQLKKVVTKLLAEL